MVQEGLVLTLSSRVLWALFRWHSLLLRRHSSLLRWHSHFCDGIPHSCDGIPHNLKGVPEALCHKMLCLGLVLCTLLL